MECKCKLKDSVWSQTHNSFKIGYILLLVFNQVIIDGDGRYMGASIYVGNVYLFLIDWETYLQS